MTFIDYDGSEDGGEGETFVGGIFRGSEDDAEEVARLMRESANTVRDDQKDMTRLFWRAYYSLCSFIFAQWSLIVYPPLTNGSEPYVIRRFCTCKAARAMATSLNATLKDGQKLFDVGEGL